MQFKIILFHENIYRSNNHHNHKIYMIKKYFTNGHKKFKGPKKLVQIKHLVVQMRKN